MIIFLGAGASKPFGIPTMSEFVYEFEKEFKEGSPGFFSYKEIRDNLKNHINNLNLEHILTVVEDLKEGINMNPINPSFIYFIESEINTWNKIVCVVVLYRTQKILYPYLTAFYNINIVRTRYGKRPNFFSKNIVVEDNTYFPYSDLPDEETLKDIKMKYAYFSQYSKFV